MCFLLIGVTMQHFSSKKQNRINMIGKANVSDSFKEKIGKSNGVTYWWPVISWYSAGVLHAFFVWQYFVPTIAMYYSTNLGLNKLKYMFLEKKSKNATVWHTQYFKMGSFEVQKKVWELAPNVIWSWLVVH